MINKMRKFCLPLITFVFTFFMFGCFSSPSKRYFQINIETSVDNNENSIKKTILLKDIIVSEFYDDYRLVYRKSPYEVNYYSYEFWSIKPGKLIKKAIINYLKTNNDYLIIGEFSDSKPDYYIDVLLNSIEEIEKKDSWYGRLSMSFALYSFKTDEKLLSFNFDKTKRFPEKRVTYLPKVISEILKNNINIFINKIKKMEKKNDKKN